MDKKEIIDILNKNFSDIKKFKVKSVYIFGSVVRGEAGLDSDIDILVEFSKPVGLFEFVRLQNYLENILSRRVDLVAKDALKAQLRDQILKEAIRAA